MDTELLPPEEKAKELIEKFDFIYVEHATTHSDKIRCAIIVAKEVINELEDYTRGLIYSDDIMAFEKLEYWNEVNICLENSL